MMVCMISDYKVHTTDEECLTACLIIYPNTTSAIARVGHSARHITCTCQTQLCIGNNSYKVCNKIIRIGDIKITDEEVEIKRSL